jgi:hypothetical protein
MNDRLRDLSGESDLVKHARQANDLLAELQENVVEISRIRREALEQLRARGWSQVKIAKALGMTPGRVSQLVAAAPPPERAFLGTGPVTVALGAKEDSPVPAKQHEVYVRLKALARRLKLSTSVDPIPQEGAVTLRNNLIVACGPRRAPSIAGLLQWDPNLGFEKDDDGWYIKDRQKQQSHRSPKDSGQPSDIGYLGRLPRRLDGKGGTFLCIAGLHEAGTKGVVHYLEHNIAALYDEVGTEHFSTLIQCYFDPDTEEILRSERITPLHRPGAPAGADASPRP